jgi:hypothetical protein
MFAAELAPDRHTPHPTPHTLAFRFFRLAGAFFGFDLGG